VDEAEMKIKLEKTENGVGACTCGTIKTEANEDEEHRGDWTTQNQAMGKLLWCFFTVKPAMGNLLWSLFTVQPV
jgi:hypothetical protein